MPYIPVSLPIELFTPDQMNAIKSLADARLLGKTCATLLKNHLEGINPSENANPLKTLKNEAEIDVYISEIHELQPLKTKFELKYIKTGLMDRLEKGDLQINTITGAVNIIEREKVPSAPPEKEGNA